VAAREGGQGRNVTHLNHTSSPRKERRLALEAEEVCLAFCEFEPEYLSLALYELYKEKCAEECEF
jgi:hypothetical protein